MDNAIMINSIDEFMGHSIEFADNIEISTDFDVSDTVEVNLNGKTLQITEGSSLNITSGPVVFTNGQITCDGVINVVGADAILVIGAGATLVTSNTINVDKRGTLIVDGGSIDASDDVAVKVTGFSLAKTNSTLSVVSGSVTSKSDYAVTVEKGGYVKVESGKVSSWGSYPIKAEGKRTVVELLGAHVDVLAVGGAEIIDDADADEVEDTEEVMSDVTEATTDEVAEPAEDLDIDTEGDNTTVDEVVEATVDEVTTEPVNEDVKEDAAESTVVESTTVSATNRSGILVAPTFVYGTASTRGYKCTITGPITILDIVNGFYKISFKAPGVVATQQGYISTTSRIRYVD